MSKKLVALLGSGAALAVLVGVAVIKKVRRSKADLTPEEKAALLALDKAE